MATANITIKSAVWSADTGSWTGLVAIDADDGHRTFSDVFILSEEATESDMLAALKTRWTSVRNIGSFVTTGRLQRLNVRFPPVQG